MFPARMFLSGIAVPKQVKRGRRGDAGWSSPVARQAHNLKVVGSNPTPATNLFNNLETFSGSIGFCWSFAGPLE
jgi:hypothetical protein